MPEPTILDRLDQLGQERQQAQAADHERQQREQAVVREALDLTISKAEIGRRLGISRQAVEQLAQRAAA